MIERAQYFIHKTSISQIYQNQILPKLTNNNRLSTLEFISLARHPACLYAVIVTISQKDSFDLLPTVFTSDVLYA